MLNKTAQYMYKTAKEDSGAAKVSAEKFQLTSPNALNTLQNTILLIPHFKFNLIFQMKMIEIKANTVETQLSLHY